MATEQKPLTILGIETSCDETAASVYRADKGVLSSFLYSQIKEHQQYGGVVPEIASRTQLEKITPIVATALETAGVTMDDIDVIAVTSKPGLAGSLLVGVSFAKGLAWATGKKIIGINHLEGHAFSASIENDIPFPYLCITASGGHTSLYRMEDYGVYTTLGTTKDDAAGEAFDKIAKLMHIPYPGGPKIEALAREVDFKDFFHYPRSTKGLLDFSFSGLKTAVLYDLVKRGAYDLTTKTFLRPDDHELKQQVSSSLLVCMGDVFKEKIVTALNEHRDIKAVAFVGGVACNAYLKNELKKVCDTRGVKFFFPSPRYCTDNGAMIAFVGAYKAARGEFDGFGLDILQ